MKKLTVLALAAILSVSHIGCGKKIEPYRSALPQTSSIISSIDSAVTELEVYARKYYNTGNKEELWGEIRILNSKLGISSQGGLYSNLDSLKDYFRQNSVLLFYFPGEQIDFIVGNIASQSERTVSLGEQEIACGIVSIEGKRISSRYEVGTGRVNSFVDDTDIVFDEGVLVAYADRMWQICDENQEMNFSSSIDELIEREGKITGGILQMLHNWLIFLEYGCLYDDSRAEKSKFLKTAVEGIKETVVIHEATHIIGGDETEAKLNELRFGAKQYQSLAEVIEYRRGGHAGHKEAGEAIISGMISYIYKNSSEFPDMILPEDIAHRVKIFPRLEKGHIRGIADALYREYHKQNRKTFK